MAPRRTGSARGTARIDWRRSRAEGREQPVTERTVLPLDEGFAELESLIERESATGHQLARSRNEAQTRFDVIDIVLQRVLEWPSEFIRIEHHSTDGYTDYELHDTGTLAIVEAKREGIGFVLPMDGQTGLCGIPALLADLSNSGLKRAMEQAMRYAGHRGVAPGRHQSR